MSLSKEQINAAKRLKRAAQNCVDLKLGIVAMDHNLSVAKIDRLRQAGDDPNTCLDELRIVLEEDGIALGSLVEWAGGW